MQDLSPSLHDRADAAARDLGGAVGITVRQQGAVLRVASSDDRAARCDQVQARLGAGPGVAAMDQQRPVVVPRVAEVLDWSAWRERARAEGFASAAAVPVPVARGVSAVLGLYSPAPGAWDPLVLLEARAHARLLGAELAARLVEPVPRGRGALEACLDVDRAIGVIMHCNGCTAQDAQATLLRASTADEVDLGEAARAVLRTLTDDEATFRPRALAVPGR